MFVMTKSEIDKVKILIFFSNSQCEFLKSFIQIFIISNITNNYPVLGAKNGISKYMYKL